MSKILVVGDLILDCEAVPAGQVDYRSHSADHVHTVAHVEVGGAARSAIELTRLGHSVTLVCAQNAGALPPRLNLPPVVIAGPEELPTRTWACLRNGDDVRVDGYLEAECNEPIDWAAFLNAAREADWVLVNDYAQGTVPTFGPEIERAIEAERLIWDPHVNGPKPPTSCKAIVPNAREARSALLRAGASTKEVGHIAGLARQLSEIWGAEVTCVTDGANGAVSCIRGHGLHYSPSRYAEELTTRAVRGAGDIFVALLADSFARGGVAVETLDAAVIATELRIREDKPARGGWFGCEDPAEDLPPTVVAVGGCFDILHVGHVRLLCDAARLGDRLVVLANDDAGVRRLKGNGRPIFSEQERKMALLDTGYVDDVVFFSEADPSSAIRRVRPDIFVKGSDYRPEAVPEAAAASEAGCLIVTLPLIPGYASTSILQKSRRRSF